ncbi:MAG: D-sedoheptulose 7-phosphate isomerase [Nanoarchaeota archaeon]|nr:MAG: D-sedoheptulose 7-phosphate isomerase [Nanoarchaeota archaeon]
MKQRLKEIMLSFPGKSVLVIGDLILDKTTKGVVNRVSPEAPVPVVEILSETYSPGGSGNVAANIASLGANSYATGILGKDEGGVILLNTLKSFGVNTSAILQESSSIMKERVIAGTQHILRIDYEPDIVHNQADYDVFLDRTLKLMSNVQAVVISDYSKGTISPKISQAIIGEAKKNKIPVVADAKPEHLEWYKGATLICLNKEEALKASEQNEERWEEICRIISKKTSGAIFITRGGESSILFDGKFHEIPVPKTQVVDKSGAGDTSSAALTLSLACGASLVEAANIANHAASIVVSKAGISTVTINEVLALLRHDISNFIRENMEVKQAVIDYQLDKIERLANYIVDVYNNKKKILIFGNGGSAADAQHFAAELVGRYKLERRALPAIALTTDTSAITAIANDYSYDQIFSRQVEALANEGDLVVGITTSGNSPNVNIAIDAAKKIGCITVGLCGKDGGKLKDTADMVIIVPSDNTPRIQETHITIIHIVCELLEKEMAPKWKRETA